MSRAALAAALLLAGCGLLHKDIQVAQEFGLGGPSTIPPVFASTAIVQPFAAGGDDLSKLARVTLQSARLESTDGQPLDYLASAAMTVEAAGLPARPLGTITAPAGGAASFQVNSSVDLKPYLAAGGQITFTFTFLQRPTFARGAKLTLVLRGEL